MAGDCGPEPNTCRGATFYCALPAKEAKRVALQGGQIVALIEDDASVRRSTERLIRLAGFQVQSFESAAEFLKSKRPEAAGCLVLDVRLPGLSGLDLQRKLNAAGSDVPIVFITGHGDIPMSVRAMKAGAVEFLTKPFRDQDLLDSIRQAIEPRGAQTARESLY